MTGSTHKLGGICAGMIAINILQEVAPETVVLVMAGSILGSLLPDIDNANSTISHKFRAISMIVKIGQGGIRLLSRLMPRKIGGTVRSFIGHRGITHSLMFPGLLLLLIFFVRGHIPEHFISGLLVGMMSHIVLDIFSGGVPLIMPLSVKRFKLANIRTGGIIEWGVRVALILVIVGL